MSGERPKDGLEDILRNPGEERELSRSRVARRSAEVKALEAHLSGEGVSDTEPAEQPPAEDEI